MNVKKLWLIGMLCLLSAAVAWAKPPKFVYLVQGETKQLPVSNIQEVAVDNPSIVEVDIDDEANVLVTGVKDGKTIIHVTYKNGKKRNYVVVVWLQDLDVVESKLKAVLKAMGLDEKLQVIKDKKVGRVYLSGTVFSKTEMKEVEQAISACGDEVIVNLVKKSDVEDSVKLNLHILEISKDGMAQLGITWPQELTFSTDGVYDESDNGLTFRDNLRVNLWTRNDFSIALHALETDNKARILAEPSIMALSGKKAEIVVGGELPIVSYQEETASVEYRPYGVVLKMTPTILRHGVNLDISCEISDVDDSKSVNVSLAGDKTSVVFKAPAFITRKSSTNVTVRDGETIIIGGLLQQKSSTLRSGLPGLMHIPILGKLFASKDFTSGKTDLVITITPQIVHLRPGKARRRSKEAILDFKIPRLSKEKAEKLLKSYLLSVRGKIGEIFSNVTRPNQKGKVILALHISKDGRLLQVRIKESSGNPVLDRFSLLTVRKIKKFPPLPPTLFISDIWVDAPIIYNGQ